MPELNIKLSKQQLASQIWKSCDDMRSDSGMDSSEYKTYIIGLLFYKWVSEQEERYLKKKFFTDFDKLTSDNKKIKEDLQKNLGYFIPKDYLFSTWFNKKKEIDIKTVSDGLIEFDNNIHKDYTKQYEGILDDLKNGLDKLGTSVKDRNNSIYKLIKVINRIPTTADDYDVLGYIYEYLISNFASSAGKKAGEFYTPHEPSEIMSRIVAAHLAGREKIKVYDPTSGSASLLMTIGNSFVKAGGGFDNVEYFAQEKNPLTHNLTRINLIMKGISPSNFNTRNNNTLLDDWPFYEANGIKKPVICDAVVSNPPYSSKWTPFDDARFEYGKAPKSKADYAFLLHDLYHLDNDGILAIVLPHGVLFRGKVGDESEGDIRKNLIDNNHIETIIGLPANIFFGTGIPTIIMILKQQRNSSDVLFIDASKEFTKEGNKNKIRECDIQKISDTAINRIEIPNYSRVVKKEEIIKNMYNLNIPRYVDSSEKKESWSIHGIMQGEIPNNEINDLDEYWDEFKSLKPEIFKQKNNSYSLLKSNFIDSLDNNEDINSYKKKYQNIFKDINQLLYDELIKNLEKININQAEENIINVIFSKSKKIKLIDGYDIYQIFAEKWKNISQDLDIILKYGIGVLKEISPIYDFDDEGEPIQTGEDGTIIPLELVKSELLKDEYKELQSKKDRTEEIKAAYEEIISNTSPDEIEDITNEDGTKFVTKEISNKINEIFEDISDGEIGVLKKYLLLLENKEKKETKLNFIKNNNIDWNMMDANKDGTYGKKSVNGRFIALYREYKFEDDSIEKTILNVFNLINEEKEINSQIKDMDKRLTKKAKETLVSLSFDQICDLLNVKWINPLTNDIMNFVNTPINELKDKIIKLNEKYSLSLTDIENKISNTEKELIDELLKLTGAKEELDGIKELMSLFGGNK